MNAYFGLSRTRTPFFLLLYMSISITYPSFVKVMKDKHRKHDFLIHDLYHLVCNKNKTTGATRGAVTAYPPGAHEFIPDL